MINIDRLIGYEKELSEENLKRYLSNPIISVEVGLKDLEVVAVYRAAYGVSGEDLRWCMLKNYMIIYIIKNSSSLDEKAVVKKNDSVGLSHKDIPLSLLEGRELFGANKAAQIFLEVLSGYEINYLYSEYMFAWRDQ